MTTPDQLLPTGDLTHDNSTNRGHAVEDSVAQDQLRAFIERIERMEEEKAAIRKQDANERMEQEAILELYMSALGMTYTPPDEE